MKGIQTIMEFTNEIYFDKNLIENSSVKISYTGKLFREFSSEVYIVFGYGPNWDNTQEQKMILTEDCFYTDINITGVETFNFCFRNNYNIWDNNNTFNYISPIYPEDINKLNDDNFENISESSSIESTDSTEVVDSEAENVSDESTDTSTSNFQNESSDVFSELLESLLNDMDFSNQDNSTTISEDSGYGLQTIDKIESSSAEDLNALFNEIYSQDLTSNSSSFEKAQNINESDLDTMFDKVFNYDESPNVSSELEELMNNILNAVLESDSINDSVVEELDAAIDDQVNIYEAAISQETVSADIGENSQIQDISNLSSEELLPAVVSTSKIDAFFDASYKFLQNVGVACRKIGALIKLKAQEYGFIKEDK